MKNLFVCYSMALAFLSLGVQSWSLDAQTLPGSKFKKDGLKIVFYDEQDGKQMPSPIVIEFEKEEELNAAFEALEKTPKFSVTEMIVNANSLMDAKQPKLVPNKVTFMAPPRTSFVKREATAEEKKEIEEIKTKMKADGRSDEDIKEWADFLLDNRYEPKTDTREYLGTIPYPEPEYKSLGPGRMPRVKLKPIQNVFVFKNSQGELEFWRARTDTMNLWSAESIMEPDFFQGESHSLVIDSKKMKRGAQKAIEEDLKKNKEDPRKMRFKLDTDGNLVDSANKNEVIIQANPGLHDVFQYGGDLNFARFLGGDSSYNMPIVLELTAKEFIEKLTKENAAGTLKEVQSHVEYKDGSEELISVDADKAPAALPAPAAKPATPATKPAAPAPKKDQRSTAPTPKKKG